MSPADWLPVPPGDSVRRNRAPIRRPRSLLAVIAMLLVNFTKLPTFGRAFVSALLWPMVAWGSPTNCATCHGTQAGPFAGSVHAGLKCQECHGGEDSYSVPAGELGRYLHPGSAERPAFEHGSSFAGHASRKKVPVLCGACHADVERMNPYGLRTDQLAAYWTSVHGRTLAAKGDDRVAVCTDCHGAHDVHPVGETTSRTHPFNVPGTCGKCHADQALMAEYGLHAEIVDEYQASVHGRLLLEQRDPGAPTCATCHGNHSAMPPGFRTVGAVCGKCHEHASRNFESSVHAQQGEHKGCVQCHGGGANRHFHLIERINQPTGVLLQRYAHLMATYPSATPEQITEATHPDPKKIITQALPTCLECHESPEDDKSLQKLFTLLSDIADAERRYLETGRRLEQAASGVVLVDKAQFTFEDAKTHLIELAPLQHTLDNEAVAAKVAELVKVCGDVNGQLDELERGLRWRYRSLVPIWVFACLFAGGWYLKYKKLRAAYVQPIEHDVVE